MTVWYRLDCTRREMCEWKGLGSSWKQLLYGSKWRGRTSAWSLHSDGGTGSKPYDVLGNNYDFPVFSRRLKEALETDVLGPDEVQFLPIKVFRPDEKEPSEFYVANILHPLPIGFQQSGESKSPLLKQRSIFRFSENLCWLFVSAPFVETYRRLRCRGAEFEPVEAMHASILKMEQAAKKHKPTRQRITNTRLRKARNDRHVQIPSDLRKFLKSNAGARIEFRQKHSMEIHWVQFVKEDQIALLRFGLDTHEYYLNKGEKGEDPELEYELEGIDLIYAVDGYEPSGILVYFPLLSEYGYWDCDHGLIGTYPGATWAMIEAQLSRYVNAQWHPRLVRSKLLRPWSDRRCNILVPRRRN